MATAHELAQEWLKNSYHRDMWRLTASAGEQVRALEETINPDDPSSEDLEKLDRSHGRAEGMEEILEGAIRAWLLDRQAANQYSQVDEAILELWKD